MSAIGRHSLNTGLCNHSKYGRCLTDSIIVQLNPSALSTFPPILKLLVAVLRLKATSWNGRTPNPNLAAGPTRPEMCLSALRAHRWSGPPCQSILKMIVCSSVHDESPQCGQNTLEVVFGSSQHLPAPMVHWSWQDGHRARSSGLEPDASLLSNTALARP